MDLIRGHGSSCASIFIIGDSGSQDDESRGYALTGPGERNLRQVCANTGLKLDEMYRTLFFKKYIKGFFGAKTHKLGQLIQAARAEITPLTFEEILIKELAAIRPNVIVPLGAQSLRFLAGVGPHSKFRGSVLHLREDFHKAIGRDTKIIPTFGHEEINIDYVKFTIALVDWDKKIKPQSLVPEFPKDDSLIWICKNGTEAMNFFRRNKQADYAAFDIETFQGLPTCISVSFDGKESVSFPLISETVSSGDLSIILYEVARFLASPIPKVAQNAKYDTIILERFRLPVNNLIGDTMLAFHTLYPELASRGGEGEGATRTSVGYGKNLGFLTSIYTDKPYFKAEGKGSAVCPPDTQHLNYNAKDSLVTHEIYGKELSELEELDLGSFYKNRVMPLFFIYRGMEKRGIRVDSQQQNFLRAKYEALFEDEVRDIQELTGADTFNPLSSDQCAEVIYKELKFPARYNRTTGSLTTEEDVLNELAILHANDNTLGAEGGKILHGILACRKLHKCLEYINTPIHPDGRLRCSWNLAGTETGRTSAGKTTDTIFVCNGKGKIETVRLGRSLQTITKHGFLLRGRRIGNDLRKMYVPSRGYIFVECDQSQAEARHVAVLANDWTTLSILERTSFNVNKHGVKDDLHTITAMSVTGLPFDEIDEETRQEGKPARHGGNYGMTAKRFALLYQKSVAESDRILKKFHESNPLIKVVFWEQIRGILQKERCLRNPFGRRRDFLGRLDEDLYKEGYAYIPQGTVSDTQKFAMLRISERFPADFLVEAHDSTLVEILPEQKEEYMVVAKEELTKPISYRNCSLSRDHDLVVPVEFTVGENWGMMRKVK